MTVEKVDPQNGNIVDIWILELTRGIMTRLTSDASINQLPIWSPDGEQIAFRSNRNQADNIYLKASNGAGTEEILLKSSVMWDWSTHNSELFVQLPADTSRPINTGI